jgi:hypothetical protein
LIYGQGLLRETHYPLFAVRRDWLADMRAALADRRAHDGAERRRLRPLMRRIEAQIRACGPMGPAEFASPRIRGGFATVKASTRALEYLFADGRVQIAGRTPQFHRLFDLTERVAPELARWRPPKRLAYERFLVASALAVLKIATAEQLARRARLHYGQWRRGSLPHFRRLVASALQGGAALPVEAADSPDRPVYWHLTEDEDAWGRVHAPDAGVRIVPPLDNLLFSRERFRELFALDYKFEAYTPAHRRRYYYAMPVLWRDAVAGLIDARFERARGGVLWIARLDLRAHVPAEALREAVHRLARQAGAREVRSDAPVPRVLARALALRRSGG